MNLDLEQLKPPKRLAIAYARRPSKDALALLLLLDVRLGEILKSSTEPLIAQMRLAWWRDVIGKNPAQRPLGEPLIAQLNRLQAANPEWEIGSLLLSIIDGWDQLLANETWNADVINRHGNARATGVFNGFAAISSCQITDELHELGRKWAINDLRNYCQNEDQYHIVLSAMPGKEAKTSARIPKALRPLTILNLASQGDVSPAVLFWHALTGR